MKTKKASFDPVKIGKIERNMKFVQALNAALYVLETEAMWADAGKQHGILTAVQRIRGVMDEHVD